MGFQNRKMFLSNEDIPIPPLQTNSSPPLEPTAALRKMHLRPVCSSDVAYTFLIVITALFIITFLLLTAREFLLRHRHQPPTSCRREDLAAAKTLQVGCYGRGDAKGAADCAVCLEEFRDGEAVKMTPYCGHVFHPACIDTWLINHVTCPVCRCAGIFRGIAVERAAEDGGAGGEVG